MSDAWLDDFQRRIADRKVSDRSFELLGEKLTVKPSVAPQVGLNFNSTRDKVIQQTRARQEALDAGKDAPDPLVTDEELLDVIEQTIRACLEPSSLPAWDKLRSPEHASPLNWFDLYSLCDYVLSRASGLPTVASVASSNGRASAGRSSRAASSSRVAGRKR